MYDRVPKAGHSDAACQWLLWHGVCEIGTGASACSPSGHGRPRKTLTNTYNVCACRKGEVGCVSKKGCHAA